MSGSNSENEARLAVIDADIARNRALLAEIRARDAAQAGISRSEAQRPLPRGTNSQPSGPVNVQAYPATPRSGAGGNPPISQVNPASQNVERASNMDALRSGLASGEAASQRPAQPNRNRQAEALSSASNNGMGGPAPLQDTRVRLRPLNEADFYGPSAGIMSVLKSRTNGMLFPYTPTVQFSQTVDYAQLGLVHSIGDIKSFQRTQSVEINITGKFTVQNLIEGQFGLGCLHFCRVASKMRFGESDPNAGLPPPVLLLSGYGTYMFNDLRCVMTNHSWSFDDTMNMVTIPVPNGKVSLPSIFTLSVTVTIQNTPAQMRTVFNMDKFRSGELLTSGGWI